MKKVLASFLIMCMLFSCALANDFDLSSEAQTACMQLLSGDYAALTARFDETMSAALSAETLEMTMQTLSMQFGQFLQVTNFQTVPEQNAAVFTLACENGTLNLTIAFDQAGLIAGLFLQPAAVIETTEKALPEGVQEKQLMLFEGTERALNACLLQPAAEKAPYVIFVHGSGASDMDETIGPNKPFRDLAYDLAARGVGSLRFDKITYAHPEIPCETVVQEYLEPVAEAFRVLREEVSPTAVYLVGHSEGGMLAPWLTKECGFDGAVVLAGTPKALWEIQWAQNLAVLEYMPQDQHEAQTAIVEAEVEKAQRLLSMSDEEAAVETVFGISALYQRSIARLDQIELVKESGKPFLFLWGENDVQVDQAAFSAWADGLTGYEKADYIVYPGLNHLFLTAQEGDSILNVQSAYSRAETVPEQVAQDIASWIPAR